jgi:hypothetical protein
MELRQAKSKTLRAKRLSWAVGEAVDNGMNVLLDGFADLGPKRNDGASCYQYEFCIESDESDFQKIYFGNWYV